MSRSCKIEAKRKIADDVRRLGCSGKKARREDEASGGGVYRQCLPIARVQLLSEAARGSQVDAPSFVDLLPSALLLELAFCCAGAIYDAAGALPLLRFLWESPAPQRRERCHAVCLGLLRVWRLDGSAPEGRRRGPRMRVCKTGLQARRILERELSRRWSWYCHLCGALIEGQRRHCICLQAMLAELPNRCMWAEGGGEIGRRFHAVMDPVYALEESARIAYGRLPYERREWYGHHLRLAAAEHRSLGTYLDRWNAALADGTFLDERLDLNGRVRAMVAIRYRQANGMPEDEDVVQQQQQQ